MAGLAVLLLLSWVANATLKVRSIREYSRRGLLPFPFVIGAGMLDLRQQYLLWWPMAYSQQLGSHGPAQGTVLAFPNVALTVTYSSLWAGYCMGTALLFDQ